MKRQKVIFSFAPESLSALEDIQETGGYATLADTVKDSLKIMWTIQNLAKEGYTELIVRNPKTDNERLVLDYEARGGKR